jgi:hypothetical protein
MKAALRATAAFSCTVCAASLAEAVAENITAPPAIRATAALVIVVLNLGTKPPCFE